MRDATTSRITASPEMLMDQAVTSARRYMHKAESEIDQLFGKGYAKEHPGLVGQFMAACVGDYHTAFQAKVSQESNEQVAEALLDIASSLDDISNGIHNGELDPELQ